MSTVAPPPGPPSGRAGGGASRAWVVALVALVVVLVGVLVWLLVARGGDDASGSGSSTSPAAPDASQAASSAPVRPPASTAPPTSTASAGCPAGGDGIPSGASVHEVVDVDGDGRVDDAWLSGGADRRFGITTASGATFSIAIDSASPVPAAAIVQRIQSDDLPIALVDLHREAFVYSLAGCAVTPVRNAQGEQYTFDRGFGDEGTGVGCTAESGVLRLAGLNAVQGAHGTYDVSRTFVDLDADGRHATNGKSEVVARDADGDEPVVTTAQEVSCGDLVAGKDGPVEPSS